MGWLTFDAEFFLNVFGFFNGFLVAMILQMSVNGCSPTTVFDYIEMIFTQIATFAPASAKP